MKVIRFNNDWQESMRQRASFRLVEDIRAKFSIKYPEVNQPPENEHPMSAVGIVLLSAVILETTDIGRLVTFTGYSPEFISAIASNMRHNRLWENGRYKEEHWSPWLDGTIKDDDQFWEHIEIACGSMWQPSVDTQFALDPCKIYWDERAATEVLVGELKFSAINRSEKPKTSQTSVLIQRCTSHPLNLCEERTTND